MAKHIATHIGDAIEQATAVSSTAVQRDDPVLFQLADRPCDLKILPHEAAAAAAYGHDMTLLQAIRLYPEPVFFSMLLSLSLMMEGPGASLLGNLLVYPDFQ
ncbi:hypothetical protein NLG97_g3182 [Lecanicillium saksenae]|uniref:Uncharacterized protein n=1 Tax=Lecanicillium saksenae TaxID=468837 RepID=A0ACC1R0J0_9HYPO|nr:hypothetical protein NLG97_g3182 [Lecanicillium saksenae]